MSTLGHGTGAGQGPIVRNGRDLSPCLRDIVGDEVILLVLR
jgi:hypothetical protein